MYSIPSVAPHQAPLSGHKLPFNGSHPFRHVSVDLPANGLPMVNPPSYRYLEGLISYLTCSPQTRFTCPIIAMVPDV
jgi:hypothetical protein